MEDWEARIEIDEENLGGKPVIKGTGVAVHDILGALAEGVAMDKVRERYGLSHEDMLAAFAYAADTVASEVIHAAPHGRINVDARIVGGKPVIAGTRVPVQLLLGDLSGDASIEEVAADYRVSEKDVLAALGYGAHSIASETIRALPRR